MRDLSNTTAAVIGGTQGMGLAAAELLIELGARVLVTGSNQSRVETAQKALGNRARVILSNVAETADIDALEEVVKGELEGLDAVLVFAGIAQLDPYDAVSEASFDRHFAINARGVFFTLQRLAPLVRTGGGIVVTTVTPGTASPTMSAYMASKASLRAFSKVMAAELVARGVRVNAVAPGFIDTPTLGIAGMTPEERAAFRSIGDEVTPMKRHGTPEEVARAALFLAFDATFTTGVELAVDGGLSEIDAP